MADEQAWSAYSDRAYLADSDIMLVDDGSGVGVNIPGSAIIKKDSSGKLTSLNATLSAWGSNFSAFQIGRIGSVNYQDFRMGIGLNYYNDGTNDRALLNGSGAKMEQDGSGNTTFYAGPSLFAGVAVSWTIAIQINSSGHVVPGAANARDLGSASLPWRNGWIQNAWTVTSDADRKKRGDGLSPAEIRAGCRIADECCWWQWLESIERKGEDGARLHFGPMAQDIARIFIEEGVEADYGKGKPSFRSDMLSWDEWPEVKNLSDTGDTQIPQEAGSGWRIDPSQVAFIVLAAIRADTDARLKKLEAA